MSLTLSATTGNGQWDGFSKENMEGKSHHVELQLSKGQKLQANIKSPAYSSEPYTSSMSIARDFNAGSQCVKRSDIRRVSLVAGGNDGWFITEVTTCTQVGAGPCEELTNDPNFNKLLDGDVTGATVRVLSLGEADIPHCGYGVPVCECSVDANKCIFNLEVDEMRTFTSYQKFPVDKNEGMFVRGTQGVIYHINDDGIQEPLEQYKDRHCANFSNSDNCTNPQFVDGQTYRMAIGVNGQIPGPTIIVHDQQEVMIHVRNNMSSEGISIHWHGMHQIGTPWMDGVGQVTQCQIGPSSSFSYIYTASPSGTFWYHSHSGAQRTDGFFGALIVKERPEELANIKNELSKQHDVANFEDFPNLHTISLLDWQHEASLDLFSQLNAGLGFHPEFPIGEIPPSDINSRYVSTRSCEYGEIGPVPFFSGLINGKGRHKDVDYSKTRLSTFPVKFGERYRFRLIGAQGLYAYRFSIDGHKLTVVNTDGYWIVPQKEVDFIIIHTGERYDFILEANAAAKNYWIRAETLEIDTKSNSPPYKPLGHVAEAILQYTTTDIENTPDIPSNEYESIKFNSPKLVCSATQECKAINCPFEDFHPSYHISCVNVHHLKLLIPTQEKLPKPYPDDGPYFINFNFEGDSETSSVNGRNFILPPVPPQTQNDDFEKQAVKCNLEAKCNPSTLDCMCTHVIDIPYQKTIQFVLTAIGSYHNAHPIHLHGHTFHVVHVGYPTYSSSTGFIQQHSTDIKCQDSCPEGLTGCDPKRCTQPSWNGSSPSLSINEHTIRKDTVMIPAGGYAVINFISDNPGHWFLHCHIEVHQLEGMALIVNEAFSQQKYLSVPEYLNKCGDVSTSMEQYEALISPLTTA